MAAPAHDVTTEIVTGMAKVAPSHPLGALASIEAAPGRSSRAVRPAPIVSLRPVWFENSTTVGVHDESPLSTMIGPFCVTLTTVIETLFGFEITMATSPVPPGSSGVAGVPAVAETVRCCVAPETTSPVPEPGAVMKPKAEPAAMPITRANSAPSRIDLWRRRLCRLAIALRAKCFALDILEVMALPPCSS